MLGFCPYLNDSFEEHRRKRLDRRVGLPGAHDLAHMTWRIADSFNPMTARSASIGFPARAPITFCVRLDVGCFAAVFSNYVKASGNRAGGQRWHRW